MDYTAFWNIVPDVALFLLLFAMTAFLVIDQANARLQASAARRADVFEAPADSPETRAA